MRKRDCYKKWVRNGVRCFSRVRKASDNRMSLGSSGQDLAKKFKVGFYTELWNWCQKGR